MLLGADHPESIKHAYASCKLLVQRCGLMSFDLLLAASPSSPRPVSIAESLAGCADNFLGAALLNTALIDPAGDPANPPTTRWQACWPHNWRWTMLPAPAPSADDAGPSRQPPARNP
jgi:hypothetical protein